jgi:hypothetical protein
MIVKIMSLDEVDAYHDSLDLSCQEVTGQVDERDLYVEDGVLWLEGSFVAFEPVHLEDDDDQTEFFFFKAKVEMVE